jgi:hypothetical protein
VPTPLDAPGLPFDPPRRIRHHRATEPRDWFKAVIRGGPEGYGGIFVEQGNHDIQGPLGRLRARRLDGLALAHFPVRDAQQLQGKAVVGWLANLARQRHRGPSGFASHWRDLYEATLEGVTIDPVTLANHALAYAMEDGEPYRWPDGVAEDPIAVDYVLRHAPLRRMSTLARTARSVELMLAQDSVPAPPRRLRRTRWQRFLRVLPRGLHPRRRAALASLPPPAGEAIDLPPLAFLARRHAPRSVLELGGRHGAHLDVFRAQGADRLLTRADGRSVELVLCAEAGAAEQAAAQASSRILLFPEAAAALPRLAGLGWHPEVFETLAVRSLASLPALRARLAVLKRGAPAPGDQARLAAPPPASTAAPPAGLVTEPMTAMLAEWAAAEGANR